MKNEICYMFVKNEKGICYLWSRDLCRTQNEISIIHSCYILGIMLRYSASKMKKKQECVLQIVKLEQNKKNGRDDHC